MPKYENSKKKLRPWPGYKNPGPKTLVFISTCRLRKCLCLCFHALEHGRCSETDHVLFLSVAANITQTLTPSKPSLFFLAGLQSDLAILKKII